MNDNDIVKLRMLNHCLSGGGMKTAEAVVKWMGAIQAQDLAQAKYAIGSRLSDCSISLVDEAFDNRNIVRTWSLRGTLHILPAADIYWLLPLMTKNVLIRMRPQFIKLGLIDSTLKEIHFAIKALLKAGRQLTRKELFNGLASYNINTDGLRGTYILYEAAWQGIICLGQMNGKQDTYTLLKDWLPVNTILPDQQARIELTKRYFQSHGPATLQDFVWWSGLKIVEARTAIGFLSDQLTCFELNGQCYWMTNCDPDVNGDWRQTCLLAGFDEYLLGYQDRSIIMNEKYKKEVILANGIFKPTILSNGKVSGTWKRQLQKNKLLIDTVLFDQPKTNARLMESAIKKYLAFTLS